MPFPLDMLLNKFRFAPGRLHWVSVERSLGQRRLAASRSAVDKDTWSVSRDLCLACPGNRPEQSDVELVHTVIKRFAL